MSAVLTVAEVSRSFGGVRALHNVSLAVEQGAVHCLVGENGSGKSTLTKIIAGVLSADAGTVAMAGHEPRSGVNPGLAIREGISVIYQDLALFPNLTVAENIAPCERTASLTPHWRWRSSAKRAAAAALEELGSAISPTTVVERLPTAERQLVAIARAMTRRPRMILMDEPTAALTHQEIDRLLALVRRLRDEHSMSFMFISHKLNEVLELADSVTVLRNGVVASEGPAADYTIERLSNDMTGRTISSARPTKAPTGREPRLTVTGLCVKGAVEDISFEAAEGEVIGIGGLLGSGRTELALSLCGLLKSSEGSVEIDGVALRPGHFQDAIKRGIAYVPEDRLTEGLFLDRSIRDNAAAAVASEHTSRLGALNRSALHATAEHWLGQLHVKTPDYNDAVNTLSGGNQQRVVLSKWLARRPRLLILNGPTVGVDVGSRHDIHETIRHLAKDGTTVIIASDDLPELLAVAHRVLVLSSGQLRHDILTGDLTVQALWEAISADSALS
ncbi:MAG: sugar ABC transporter ATP-binding protein [Acidimicrobiia bacterium]|nr:sugar ABC transporter ATP-binding protein [Acidimicrobiia bacterium]MCY4457828.1 sugar ABC transporter ATP-binding protein [Acidimicrobiaceae bacterium]